MTIPKYKRDAFTFISNLNETTASIEQPETLKRNGYLLSEYYSDDVYISLAKFVRGRRNLLISDNGNFSRMKDVAKPFQIRGEQLLEEAKDDDADFSVINQKRTDLILEIRNACKEAFALQDQSQIIENQLVIRPHYLIGLEDLTIPVIMLSGLLEPVFRPDPIEIKAYQKNTFKLYKEQCSGQFGHLEKLKETIKFCVLHSYDFKSAFQGAQNANEIEKEGVAISYGGAVSSRRWITEWNLGDETITLPKNLPEMYLLIASISLGYLKGTENKKLPVHILGVGSPIIIALLGLLFQSSNAVSIDSTAPFKDAYQNKVYGSKFGLLKLDMFKMAAYALIDDIPYDEKTPFYTSFVAKYPHNWTKMREELGVNSSTSPKKLADTIEERQDLVLKYIPFFLRLKTSDNPIFNDLRLARSGHNYWIIHKICAKVKSFKHNKGKLEKWFGEEVAKYKKVADKNWAMALETILKEVLKT